MCNSKVIAFNAVAVVFAVAGLAQAADFNLTPSADTSIYKENPGNSNGAGFGLYSGNAAGSADETRRAMLRFDLATVPPGSLVRSAALTMTVTRTTALEMNVGLHRLSESWGESTSAGTGSGTLAAVGDATWNDRFIAETPTPNTPWLTAGGSYVAAPSATATVGAAGTTATWTSTALATDVDSWAAASATNFGWIVINNEAAARTVKQFGSREDVAANRPSLNLNVRVGGDTSNDDQVDFTDLLTLAQNYGTASGATFDTGDFTRDGAIDFGDLLILAQNYNFGVVQSAQSTFASDWAAAQSLVPEPATAISAAIIGMASARRRRAISPH